jgi:hypothetical protein
MPAFSAYHNVDGNTHQANVNNLQAKGFRPVSLSCYGDADDPLYAAVWFQTSGPAWRAVHGKSADQYQELFNIFTSEGYSPTIITATGSGSGPTFAGVFEKNGKETLARFGLKPGGLYPDPTDPRNSGQLASLEIWAHQYHYRMRWISTYGDDDDVCYAAIWEKEQPLSSYYAYLGDPLVDPSGVHNWIYFDVEFQQRRLQGETPALITVYTDAAWYSAIWYRSNPWGDWRAHHHQTASQYQQSFNDLTGAGFHPVRVQGGGDTGSDIRFASIFAK